MKYCILSLFALFSCMATYAQTPGPVTGASLICIGYPQPLSDVTPGGVWSSSSLAVATVDIAGTVTGIGSGTAIITYTVGTSYATHPVTVNTPPSPITGPTNVCVGATITVP